ncbi:hypothetical protein LzC2_04220 [Planctomycetes bacterium LzC2]|uniref:Uncharacterized protein n=2 Tax=Alienimonas chondri TaxID=2681879 RepID=A0ABX1VA32_9PLAN|nr:hypothetical protein [Alienimonas chondri]
MLGDLIRSAAVDEDKTRAYLSTGSGMTIGGRIKIVAMFGLVPNYVIIACERIAEIRNRAAHFDGRIGQGLGFDTSFRDRDGKAINETRKHVIEALRSMDLKIGCKGSDDPEKVKDDFKNCCIQIVFHLAGYIELCKEEKGGERKGMKELYWLPLEEIMRQYSEASGSPAP